MRTRRRTQAPAFAAPVREGFVWWGDYAAAFTSWANEHGSLDDMVGALTLFPGDAENAAETAAHLANGYEAARRETAYAMPALKPPPAAPDPACGCARCLALALP